jgi:DnaJ-class molecular chaperone
MSRPTTRTVEIILCSSCKGEGKIEESELTDYHRGEYRCWDEMCTRCKGSGRMKKTVETYQTIEPYTTPEIEKK